MKKTACQLAAAALALLILCVICRFCFFRTYPMYYHLAPAKLAAAQARGFRIVSADPSVASAGPAEIRDGVLRIPVIPGQRGETTLELQDAEGRSLGFIPVRVTRFQTVYESVSGGFSGDSMAMVASTVFWIFACFIMIRSFCRARGPAFYRHDTIYYAGFALFSGITGLNLFAATLRHLVHPESYSMLELYSALSGASMQFLRLTAPLAVIFAIFMAAGNIALFLRVRPRARNALGLGVSLLLVLGIAAGLRLYSLDFSGSEWEMRIRSALLNTYATVFVYFECMLTGSVICGLISAHHVPSLPRDFIIILGCWFRPDGSLPPLIRGRVDRALAYWRKQRESTGLEAVFVPSGGCRNPLPETPWRTCSSPGKSFWPAIRIPGLSFPPPDITSFAAASGLPWPACRPKASAAGPNGGSGPTRSCGKPSAFFRSAGSRSCFFWARCWPTSCC